MLKRPASLGVETRWAVHRPVWLGLEGYLSVFAAQGTDSREELSWGAWCGLAVGVGRSRASRSARGPAGGTPTRLSGESMLSKEVLLTDGEDETAPALAAGERFVGEVHDWGSLVLRAAV